MAENNFSLHLYYSFAESVPCLSYYLLLTLREKNHPAKELLTALGNVKARDKPMAFYTAFVILNSGVECSPGCWISSHNMFHPHSTWKSLLFFHNTRNVHNMLAAACKTQTFQILCNKHAGN